jgi:hypothetical protein
MADGRMKDVLEFMESEMAVERRCPDVQLRKESLFNLLQQLSADDPGYVEAACELERLSNLV